MMKKKYFIALSLLVNAVVASFTLNAQAVYNQQQSVVEKGNGYYLNPVISGNYGDPSIVRVKNDFYMAFSRGDGFIIWHSQDLLNWKIVKRHFLPAGFNKVWAIDLQYFNNRFYIYMPVQTYPGKKQEEKGFGNFVVTAAAVDADWSSPIKIEIPAPPNVQHWGAIDPGFIQTPEGKKYLYISAGWVIELDTTGTKSVGNVKKVYDGWKYPDEWNVECMCLESPKLFYKDGFYYMVSAQGGTSGPSTAHMSVVARSKNATGPWENSPFNPITHTYSEEEKWWQQGHGTIFNAPDGSWWTVYHARLKNYTGIGRQTLLMPVEWTKEGWPVIKNGISSDELIPAPSFANGQTNNISLSDDFTSAIINPQWYYDFSKKELFKTGNGTLQLTAIGKDHRDGTMLTVGAINKSFEVTVEIEMPVTGAKAGIALENDGLSFDGTTATFTEAPDWRMNGAAKTASKKGHVFLKIKNYRKDISLFYSDDGKTWISFGKGIRKEDSYKIKLFAAGSGEVKFKNFQYKALE